MLHYIISPWWFITMVTLRIIDISTFSINIDVKTLFHFFISLLFLSFRADIIIDIIIIDIIDIIFHYMDMPHIAFHFISSFITKHFTLTPTAVAHHHHSSSVKGSVWACAAEQMGRQVWCVSACVCVCT